MSTDSKTQGRSMSRALISVLVLAASGVLGMGAYTALTAMYAPPAEREREEAAMEVDALAIQPQSYTMILRGWGEAKSIDMVPISSKVPGEVLELHPMLKMGNTIEAGETLIRIDVADLDLLRGQAESNVKKAEAAIARMKAQYELDSKRLLTVQRSMALAKSEFEKDKALYEERNVGSQSMVNAAELNYNQVLDAYDQVKNALDIFPIVLEEAETMLAAAKLQLEKVELDLSRTEIKAPYTGRVKMAQVEVGQTIAPGMPLVVFANDSELEISVPLESIEARKWLRFKEGSSPDTSAWFGDVEPAACTVYWTEDKSQSAWKGALNRVERFDQMTRTVTVSVRVASSDASAVGDGLPLVDGMFCEVEIEGRTLDNVYALPRWAVSFENEVYVADDSKMAGEYRLKRIPVEVLGFQNEMAIIANTLPPGTRIVTTKLHNPLRNSLLQLVEAGAESATATPEPPAQ